MNPKIVKTVLLIPLASILCGCYPNPTDDDFCVVPIVNNRDITKEKDDPFRPKASF
jgi:hypothetical protein